MSNPVPGTGGTFGPNTVESVLRNAQLQQPLPRALGSLPVTGIEYDSRRVQPGVLFFAFSGAKVDGRQFAGAARAKGASAVVSELPAPADYDGAWIQVPHGRKALASAAKIFYGAPDEQLRVTGVTGTNGKTTTTYLLDQMLRSAGYTTALIGTIEYHLAGKVLPAVNTTPESLDLFRLFRELLDLGGTHAVMETSSHALDLGRVYGLHYHTAVFTNLTQDHLDHHKTMEAYFAAKQRLFTPETGVAAPAAAVLNFDDAWSRKVRTDASSEVYWYGMQAGAAYRAENVRSTFQGLRFDLRTPNGVFAMESPMVGHINVYNILAAFCSGLSLGVPVEVLQKGIAACASVPGRFERIDVGQPFLVVVDYAHTSDALLNVIQVARELKPKRVVTLFGCGGDRDRAKRPLMGAAAAEHSDYVVVTSDNPRSEDPLAIINDAMVGVRRFDTPHIAEPDREKGIRRALDEAQPGDIVILAGKGHEPYQVLRDRTIAFDDREVARRLLKNMGYGAA
ncbi:MAG: UDP-N-acetylmuramoyl-L-alanyl-D-glutamate--2,6-diaminopimelate ligase [Acidobacteria bacterium]|nr:UDP-N-acetylmuramoyl-L-alanyl-D-glutamate--2,6-diaminopimelate ligase [Acidobacteriota bacterium]